MSQRLRSSSPLNSTSSRLSDGQRRISTTSVVILIGLLWPARAPVPSQSTCFRSLRSPEVRSLSFPSFGVAPQLLLLSALLFSASDMFHRKIVMGGNTFCHWSTTTKEKCADYCRKKALKLGWRPRPEGKCFLAFRENAEY